MTTITLDKNNVVYNLKPGDLVICKTEFRNGFNENREENHNLVYIVTSRIVKDETQSIAYNVFVLSQSATNGIYCFSPYMRVRASSIELWYKFDTKHKYHNICSGSVEIIRAGDTKSNIILKYEKQK